METKFFVKRESVSPSLLDSERQSDEAFVPLTNHAITAIMRKDEIIFGTQRFRLGLASGKYMYHREVRDFYPSRYPCRSFVAGRARCTVLGKWVPYEIYFQRYHRGRCASSLPRQEFIAGCRSCELYGAWKVGGRWGLKICFQR